MSWLFVIALAAIVALFVRARRSVVLLFAFVLLLGVLAVFVRMQWGNEGLGL